MTSENNKAFAAAECEICLRPIIGEENVKHFKWPDAAMDGSDIDGTCCRFCSTLSPLQQLHFHTLYRTDRRK